MFTIFKLLIMYLFTSIVAISVTGLGYKATAMPFEPSSDIPVELPTIKINTSAGELKVILKKVNTGDGTLSTLINDTISANNLKRSLVNIDVSAKKLPELMEALKHNFLFKNYFKKQEKSEKKK